MTSGTWARAARNSSPSDASRRIRLSAAEARRLVEAAADDRMPARWLVGLALGLRQGGTLGLWWSDVDLDNGLLRVRRGLQRQRGGGLVFTEPKTMRSKRTIPLPPPLVGALRQHQARQERSA
jgi:integrase